MSNDESQTPTPGGLPAALDPEIVAEFAIESTEQLADVDTRLLELERNPNNKEALNAIFRCFHTIKGVAGFLNLEELQSTAHAAEDLLDQVRSGHLQLAGKPLDLIFEAADVLKQMVRQVADCLAQHSWPPPVYPRASDVAGKIRALWSTARRPSQAAERPSGTTPEAVEEAAASTRSSGPDKTIRVDAERLDLLVDLVGELVITQSMVHRASHLGEAAVRDLRRHLVRLDKITRELQELAGSLRMIPVQGLFRKMARLARDVGKKANKQVTFEVSGEETELDKTLVEKIADPLVHLVRNAIDHGLEPDPGRRTGAGKPAVGRVWLRATHKGGSIHIELEDDGRGLDRDSILAKAIERGLLRADDNPSDRELFALICEPGFSTATQVTALSGRGVGMDVVKRNITAMGGTLEIRSERGVGTCFTMRLPLTLAVIDGLLVRAGSERYVIPTLAISRLVVPRPNDVTTMLEAQALLNVEGHLIPMLRLTTLFGTTSSQSPRLAVVTEFEGTRAAILVDELVGQQQAVIKSLGRGLGETPGISGCAILPDGRVGLVLDVGGLLRLAHGKSGAGGATIPPPTPPGQSGDAAWSQ